MLKLKNKNLLKKLNFIGGEWVSADSGETFEILNPFNGEVIASVPKCGKAETTRAIQVAHAAFDSFKAMSPKARADLLHKWADLIEENADDLAYLMTLEQGKPLREAKAEVMYGNSFNRWFAEEARRVYGDYVPADNPSHRYVVIKQPIGVVAAITPWNFPNAMITRKCAPALAVGCPVVVKPAEDTPLSALALAALAEEAGFPKGVFNIVTGDPQAIGLELSTHPWVRKLSFTGSTRVGKLLMKQAADTVKKLSLELGGNAPFIVFEDADLDAAIEGLMASKFRNAGQTCICANRIFVQENVLDAFVKKLKPAVAALKVGNGLNNPEQGPLINKAAVTKVLGLIEDAEALGAHLLVGGKKAAESDFCIQPTLMTGITSKMKIAHEEIFGPVIGIQTFKSDAEVIKHANHTPFGLASYFFSRDLSRVWRVAEALEYGMVGINTGLISNEMCPFGGVKESGFGREGSKYGLDDYLVIKYICMAGV